MNQSIEPSPIKKQEEGVIVYTFKEQFNELKDEIRNLRDQIFSLSWKIPAIYIGPITVITTLMGFAVKMEWIF